MTDAPTWGEGPARVLCLHGFLGQGRNLAGLCRRLADLLPAASFAAPTLAGHLRAPALPPEPRLDHLVTDLVERVPVRPHALLGHSLGGRVALAASAAWGVPVPVLLLDVGPGPLPASGPAAAVIAALCRAPDRAERRADMQEALRDLAVPSELLGWLSMNLVPDSDGGVRWGIDRERLASLHRAIREEDLWPRVERARVPIVACVRGERSPFVSGQEAERLAAAGAQVRTVPGAGHFVHVEAPGATAAAVARALRPALARREVQT